MGETLAERIENEIIASGWKVGDVIGSESDLRARYGVSRAVFREAIRIVGHHGVAEMRRGPGGGLVVMEPRIDTGARTVSLNLDYLQITPRQINEARSAIEIACVHMVAQNLTAAGADRIRAFLAEEVDMIVSQGSLGEPRDDFPSNHFHVLLAELTGNPAMMLFVQILSQVTSRHSVLVGSAEELHTNAEQVHKVHSKIAEAILKKDVEGAKRRMRRHLVALVDYLHD
ncbi:MAG TPA: FCD domain-containing protein [Ilumatobacteraceae bacterium]|nr:FCD domain-containing protein [Ilumatobacteraceae bacterium]